MSDALLGAFIGAAIGGVLSLLGSIIAGRRALTREQRVDIVLVEIPKVIQSMDRRPGGGGELIDDAYFRLTRVAAVAGRRDRKRVAKLDDAVAEFYAAIRAPDDRILDSATGQLVNPEGGSGFDERLRSARAVLVIELVALTSWFEARLNWRWWQRDWIRRSWRRKHLKGARGEARSGPRE